MGHLYHHNYHQRTTTFLPTFCRISINDVKLTSQQRRNSSAAADDPSSPKVSCTGQVKRNNKVLGFPTPHHNFVSAAARGGTGGVNNISQYSFRNPNLKRLFTGKSLTPTTAATSAGGRRVSRNCARKSRKVKNQDDENSGGGVNVSELDPPLPVVKRVVQQEAAAAAGEVNLWKRRSGGAALKILQIQLDKNNLLLPPSTV